MPELETARLRLRMFMLDDLDALARILGDPDVIRYVGTGQPTSREETANAMQSFIRHWQQHGFGRWAVVEKERGELIGYGGLRSLFGTPEVTYLLAKSYWGQGLATEVARACLRYGFSQLVSERIVAVTKLENVASQRVLQKVGMKYERHAHYYGIEVVCYRILREEYRPDELYQEAISKEIIGKV